MNVKLLFMDDVENYVRCLVVAAEILGCEAVGICANSKDETNDLEIIKQEIGRFQPHFVFLDEGMSPCGYDVAKVLSLPSSQLVGMSTEFGQDYCDLHFGIGGLSRNPKEKCDYVQAMRALIFFLENNREELQELGAELWTVPEHPKVIDLK